MERKNSVAKHMLSLLCLVALCTTCLLSGCQSNGKTGQDTGNSNNTGNSGNNGASGSLGGADTQHAAGSTADNSTDITGSAHEPITLMDAQRDYSAVIDLVHERYPEINIEIVPYRGRNMSAYMKQQLYTDHMPDIYSSTKAWDPAVQSEHLVDLSHYSIVDQYVPARLDEYTYEGGLYLLPFDYSINGILCNRSLLERHNIAIPSSFTELRDVTIPALEAADIKVASCLLDLPGAAFQYFFNIGATDFINTLEGRNWRSAFTDAGSDTFAADCPELEDCADYVSQWIDCGMLNYGEHSDSHDDLLDDFTEGNTAFLVGAYARFSQNEDGTGDQYCLLPYLSADGTQNQYLTNPGRLYGLNKELEEPGNEQKLEDALHFLEVLSSPEGFLAIHGSNATSMCSINDFELPEDSVYREALESVSLGHAMNMLYVGWEAYLVPFGEAMTDWIKGDISKQEALQVLDDTKRMVSKQGVTVYATATEDLDTVQAAELTGQMFMAATDADAALISYNIHIPGVEAMDGNSVGANGTIIADELTDENITIFLPTGWYDHILTASLPGSKIKEMAAEGCDCKEIGYYYPYVYMTADGKPLEDNKTYTVVLCGYTVSEAASLNITDTGIVGLDAAKEYLTNLGELRSASLDASLVQSVAGAAAQR